jgi:acyl-CoA reductase-like NAD-dependent aldehyde dehydrogenase
MALETLTTISPITNAPVLTRPGISSEELALLPKTAQAAFNSFSQSTTLEQRQQIVARALGILAKNKDALGRELTEQIGRPISYTGVEITTAVKRGEFLNRTSSSVLGEEGIVDGEAEKGFKRYIKRQPVGVVLIIFAWNVRQETFPVVHRLC